jgi:sec-independent protein translocase protein TatB
MFDITSSKLLLLGIVALLVIGPKDFPALLRTIGKYVGMIKQQAKEFRTQFDEAMRESELAQLKQDMEKMAHETESSLNAAGQSVERTLDEARQTIDAPLNEAVAPAPDPLAADPLAHDANGLPIAPPAPAAETASPLNGSDHDHAAGAPAAAPAESVTQTVAEPARPAEKTGA